MAIDDGGPAFPGEVYEHVPSVAGKMRRAVPGMSLRDHFAGLAMAAIIAKAGYQTGTSVEAVRSDAKARAKGAYEYADAMIAERNGRAG